RRAGNGSRPVPFLRLLALGRLFEDFQLVDPRPLLERPLQADAAADRDLADAGQRVLVGAAAVLGGAAAPVRHVAAALLLAVGPDLDPVLALGRDHADHRAFLALLALVVLLVVGGRGPGGQGGRQQGGGREQGFDHERTSSGAGGY